ncbi:MAG TPA: Ig domain-containing protein [Acidobacteriaceae bacterium]|nr:Ig domain-containing protein [Acidobacteriaceae bacterium]
MKIVKAIGASIGVVLCFFYLGCGSIPMVAAGVPNIDQIVPAPLIAGTQGTILKIVGSNFDSGSKVLWNGTELSTTVVDSNTLSSPVESANLAVPGVVQLAVKNVVSGRTSPAFKVAVTSGASSSISISPASLPAGTMESPYSVTFTATGGTAPYSWSVGSGRLPAGLTLDATTGTLSGTPTSSGSFSLSIAATDSSTRALSKSASYSLTVTAIPLGVGTASLPNGTANASYSQTLTPTGGSPNYHWSIVSGSLPPGLSLSPPKGTISGTPTASGTYSFTTSVKDSESPAQTASKPFSITVIAPAAPALQITSRSLPSGTSGSTYSTTLAATGGTTPYAWSLSSGSLPAGITLSSAGILSGTTTATGTFNFFASVSDNSSPVQTQTVSLSLVVSATTLKVMTNSLPNGTSGAGYTQALQATGGTPTYKWGISSGSLPPGLALNQSTGAISGTPNSSGTSTFTATVADSTNPSQTASSTLSITTTGPALAITSPSLPSLGVGTTYTQQLQATGGTSPYSWSLASGSLPPGVTLSSSGLISGSVSSATSSYTYTFSVKVQDASSPVQTATTNTSIALIVNASPLSISTSSLPSTIVGGAYSATLQATGGTPAYTWSISGALPAGLTLAATTGVISGAPSASGTSTFTVTVSDNGSPVQKQSATLSVTTAAAPSSPSTSGTTWYVRSDGGTRYSTNQTNGQCDGLADVPYPGTGVNQHCAFNDARFLWQDGSWNYGDTFPGFGWIGKGGDTYIIRGSIADGVSYRVGWAQQTSCLTTDGNFCWGVVGNQYQGIPVPPSGTPTAHTRILGGNFGACTSQSARTQLHGGWGVWTVLSLTGTSNVDVACLDITDFSNCGKDNDTYQCQSNGAVVSDYAYVGIQLNNKSTNITLTDVRVHGMATDGFVGATGDGFVAKDVAIVGNADAGWNADDGSGTTGIGSFLMQNFDISWNGCVEEYPIVDRVPYFSCRDQSTGGYGDGFGTASLNSPAPGWQVHFDQGTVSYNTQDGLDALHIGGPGSSVAETRVTAFGNEGQQLKVGGATATIQNSVIIGNCAAIATQTIPGRPSTTLDNLANYCRAGNTAVFITVTPGDPASFQGNTLYTGGNIGLEVEYATGVPDPTDTLKYNDNVFVGFVNPDSGQSPTPIYSNTDLNMLTNAGASWSNNAYYGVRYNWACPQAGEQSAVCTTPGLVDQTYHLYGYGNMAPASTSSRVAGAGVAVPSISTDITGTNRPAPPSMGAYELPQ